MSKDKAADYFARHKESNECHITSDGRVFHSIGSASGFANTLKDNKVISYTRESFESKVPTDGADVDSQDDGSQDDGTQDQSSEDEGSDDEGSSDEGSEDEGSEDEGSEKNEALEALKNFDATVAGYPEIKALVKALGLDTENQKEATLVAALEAHKTAINLEVNA